MHVKGHESGRHEVRMSGGGGGWVRTTDNTIMSRVVARQAVNRVHPATRWCRSCHSDRLLIVLPMGSLADDETLALSQASTWTRPTTAGALTVPNYADAIARRLTRPPTLGTRSRRCCMRGHRCSRERRGRSCSWWCATRCPDPSPGWDSPIALARTAPAPAGPRRAPCPPTRSAPR